MGKVKLGNVKEHTAAMRSTSNRLLRIKQASASSILQVVSGACSHRTESGIKREREREKERTGEDRKEGICMLLCDREERKKMKLKAPEGILQSILIRFF